jgi:hypothetical protein
MGTCDFALVGSIEIDPDLVIARADLQAWLAEAVRRIEDEPLEAEHCHAIHMAVVACWRAGETELGCLLDLAPAIARAGLGGLLLRAACQIVIDAQITEMARPSAGGENRRRAQAPT